MNRLMQRIRTKSDPELMKDYLLLVGILLLGLIMRYWLFPVSSGDQTKFLIPWYNYMKANGGFLAVGNDIGDYMPTYYYILAGLTYLPVKAMTGIKVVSCIADVFLAYYGMRLVQLGGISRRKSLLAFSILFILPSVVFNSSAWGQCDSIYTTFLLMCLYYLMTNKDIKAIVCFTLSFVFKLQAIFFAPLLLLLFIKGKIRFRALFAFPAVFVASILPAVAVGGGFTRLLTVYFRQATQYSALNMNLPNAWVLFHDVKSEHLARAGVFFAGAVVLIMLYVFLTKKYELTNQVLLGLAVIFAFMVPFVLPHMHERYYYLADALCVVFVFWFPKRYWLILTTQFCSIQAISPFLFSKEIPDLQLLMVITLINILAIGWTLNAQMALSVSGAAHQTDNVLPAASGAQTKSFPAQPLPADQPTTQA